MAISGFSRYSARHLCRVLGGRDPSLVDFAPAVRPVYGSPYSLDNPVPCCHALAEIIDRIERITELETAFPGGNPVNGVDIASSAKQRFHAIRLTRHECRADYRLKPKTGVNARASFAADPFRDRHCFAPNPNRPGDREQLSAPWAAREVLWGVFYSRASPFAG